MTLEVNEKELTIMGIKFNHCSDFDAVWYSISSNMIEGWIPHVDFIIKMKEHMEELRKKASECENKFGHVN